jgi:hypothetical protein
MHVEIYKDHLAAWETRTTRNVHVQHGGSSFECYVRDLEAPSIIVPDGYCEFMEGSLDKYLHTVFLSPGHLGRRIHPQQATEI